MQARDGHFLRRQAELCITLSRTTFDLTVAGRLRTMAHELEAKAAEWEDEAEGHLPRATNGNSPQSRTPRAD